VAGNGKGTRGAKNPRRSRTNGSQTKSDDNMVHLKGKSKGGKTLIPYCRRSKGNGSDPRVRPDAGLKNRGDETTWSAELNLRNGVKDNQTRLVITEAWESDF